MRAKPLMAPPLAILPFPVALVGDAAAALTCGPNGRIKAASRMKSPQVQKCLEKAAYCEHMARIVSDADARLQFAEVAKQWQHLAKQTEELESEQATLPQTKGPRSAS